MESKETLIIKILLIYIKYDNSTKEKVINEDRRKMDFLS